MTVGIVVSNILYPAVAVLVAMIGAVIVWARHRKPKSVEANVASFHRGLRALAPDTPTAPSGPSWGGARRPPPEAAADQAPGDQGARTGPAPEATSRAGPAPEATAPAAGPEAAPRAQEATGPVAPDPVPNEEADTG